MMARSWLVSANQWLERSADAAAQPWPFCT